MRKEVPLTVGFRQDHPIGKAIVEDDGTLTLQVLDTSYQSIILGDALKMISLGVIIDQFNRYDQPKYLVTDGFGLRIEFRDKDRAEAAFTSPLYHMYEWDGTQYVQIK